MNKSITSELLSLAADRYNCYSGELVTYHIRFCVPEQPKAILQFTMPSIMEVESYQLPPEISAEQLSMTSVNQEKSVLIPLSKNFIVGQLYDIQIQTRFQTFALNQYLVTEAYLTTDTEGILASDTLQVAVFDKAKNLKYLPEIYDSDDFTSRFLMLFESFWKPIDQQINQLEYYFDPDLTPPDFVPWLASWLGLSVDTSLPLSRVRSLLKNAMMLYQYRGTSQALKSYLEIYTDGEVDIIEQRSKNFILGKDSSLGVDIALGSENQPNSILINLRMPKSELERAQYSEEMYQRKINKIVRTMVPAHTNVNAKCAFYA